MPGFPAEPVLLKGMTARKAMENNSSDPLRGFTASGVIPRSIVVPLLLLLLGLLLLLISSGDGVDIDTCNGFSFSIASRFFIRRKDHTCSSCERTANRSAAHGCQPLSRPGRSGIRGI